MDSSFSQEKLYVCLGPRPRLSFLVTPSFPHPPPLCLPPLSPSRLLPPAQWGTTVCRERSYPLDLAPGLLIYFISHRFSILCHFFLSPTPSLPLPSFFLSTESFSSLIPYKHTNRISISQRGKKEWKKQESEGMGQDRIFHQSELWENVHKQIEKYRYAGEVKMRKEVERKINTPTCTQVHAHTQNKVCVLWMGPTYKAAIYLYTITAALHSEVSKHLGVTTCEREEETQNNFFHQVTFWPWCPC